MVEQPSMFGDDVAPVVAVPKDGEYTEEFERFYAVYPRKMKKRDAQKAWTSLRRKGYPAEFLMEQVAAYQFKRDKYYVPYPASWLNGRRWEDEDATAPQRAGERGVNDDFWDNGGQFDPRDEDR